MPVSERGSRGISSVRSVERAMDILTTLSKADGPMSIAELARLVDLPYATVQRLLLVHERSGFVQRDRHMYRLGPAVVTLAGEPSQWPPLWMVLTAAALGVAAHFLNTLPDFEADAATGIQGLPHRLGATPSRVIATVLLLVASATAVLGPDGAPGLSGWVAMLVVALLAVVALLGRGKAPFYAAIAIALVDVVLLTVIAP